MQDVTNVGATDYFNQQYKQYIGWINLPNVTIAPVSPTPIVFAGRSVITAGAASALHLGPRTRGPHSAMFYSKMFMLKIKVILLLFV